MEPNKKRTPSRCREWERQRRIKFNEAIAVLGEAVKTANHSNDKDVENVQYPKIEIIQKAIICLTNYAQEKTQLKAEILALQVKLEAKSNKKDASTQVCIRISRKCKNEHQNSTKLSTLKEKTKIKCSETKEKPIKPRSSEFHVENETTPINDINSQTSTVQKLPKLLPRSKVKNKGGSENTIVVLPAAPYIFPQRPLLFPAVPPAFVFLDSNLQTFNKSSVPIACGRTNGDVTKTTMVNILPISAYSRPLSATKAKKNGAKVKGEEKKSNKKNKSDKQASDNSQVTNSKEKSFEKTQTDAIDDTNKNISKVSPIEESKRLVTPIAEASSRNDDSKNLINDTSLIHTEENDHKTTKLDAEGTKNEAPTPTSNTDVIPVDAKISETINNDKGKNINNVPLSKPSLTEKDKDNKISSILDTTLCEHTVDGGNARLELAEELLAASPTAAFLMSFPLVSGNRADSPAEESQNMTSSNKDNSQKRNDMTVQSVSYFEKPNNGEIKDKPLNKLTNESNSENKEPKYANNTAVSKQVQSKVCNGQSVTNVTTDNPFLNLPMPSLISAGDSNFGLDFDANINKSISSQTTSYANNNNIFYKNDPFNTVKSTIYSTSTIPSGHELNSLGLYPCAMEKYTSKTKTDYGNMEDNILKMGSSRLTYDIDLGWSHKSLDFANCTTVSNTLNKDAILTTTVTSYSTSYNPFNPEFHMPFVSNSNKKDFSNKPNSSFSDTITSFYSQPTNLWPEEVPFYSSNSISKTFTTKEQNYNTDYSLSNNNQNKSLNTLRQFENKQASENNIDNRHKSSGITNQVVDKFTKKTISNKMHINWMTSEIRTMQNNCNSNSIENKSNHKPTYGQQEHITKKQNHPESNFFSLPSQTFTSQVNQDEFQVWPSTRPLGTTEISIEPPVNLPTLVGDLALGPHDKKKNLDVNNRTAIHTDVQNCSNFLSVTQLMNRSSEHMSSRYQDTNIDSSKPTASKQNVLHFINDTNRKPVPSRVDNLSQPCYAFSDSKPLNSYENVNQCPQSKTKAIKSEKAKVQKHSYSAEALIRGGTCSQRVQDVNHTKFMVTHQKINDYTAQNAGVAQVSHFPQILDYSDNQYGQQFVGTTLYNSSTNTISNSFYSNFIPGSSNLVPSNYTNGPLPTDFVDYGQSTDCNYTNHKYEEPKIRNNSMVLNQEKVSSSYKSSRRENTSKHKLECSKKDSAKKYQSKRPKLNSEVEEWNDSSNLFWQNKTPTKRHSNLMSEELPYHNYVGNQVPTQYQPEYFNSHLIPSNMQGVGHNIDRSFSSFPATSRTNFNLSTIFPEITMKVQS